MFHIDIEVGSGCVRSNWMSGVTKSQFQTCIVVFGKWIESTKSCHHFVYFENMDLWVNKFDPSNIIINLLADLYKFKKLKKNQ